MKIKNVLLVINIDIYIYDMSGVTKELWFHICCYELCYFSNVCGGKHFICVQVKLSAISLGGMPHTLNTSAAPELLSVFHCS